MGKSPVGPWNQKITHADVSKICFHLSTCSRSSASSSLLSLFLLKLKGCLPACFSGSAILLCFSPLISLASSLSCAYPVRYPTHRLSPLFHFMDANNLIFARPSLFFFNFSTLTKISLYVILFPLNPFYLLLLLKKSLLFFPKNNIPFPFCFLFCFVFLRQHGIIDTYVQIKPTCSKRYVWRFWILQAFCWPSENNLKKLGYN